MRDLYNSSFSKWLSLQKNKKKKKKAVLLQPWNVGPSFKSRISSGSTRTISVRECVFVCVCV
jgi:hypothetical protein